MKIRHALALSLLPAMCACTHGQIKKDEVVWPLPPETPRIRFVTAFAGTPNLDQSKSGAFRRWLVGERDPVLRQPMGMALSDDGSRLYIADYLLNQVIVADFHEKRMRTLAPEEPLGHAFGVALDNSENIYVTDASNHEVRVFSRAGKPLRAFGTHDLERPAGIAIDRTRGLVYVVDGGKQGSQKHRVLVYQLEGRFVRELGPTKGTPGLGSDDGQFHFPTYVAVDREGSVYVADTLNFRIQVFDAEGRFKTHLGEGGDGPGTFSRLKGLALDGFGNLYAVDAGHGVVQIFNSRQ